MAEPGLAPGGEGPPPRDPRVDWITDGTRRDGTVLAAVPPLYERYAVLRIPDDDDAKRTADAALVDVLTAAGPPGPWLLGYLDTGVADAGDGERVGVYVGWPYVLRQGGPEEALLPRRHTPWHSPLPELLFPADRSWLVSTLWDDDWRCVGGPAVLVDAMLDRPEVLARQVGPDEDQAAAARSRRVERRQLRLGGAQVALRQDRSCR